MTHKRDNTTAPHTPAGPGASESRGDVAVSAQVPAVSTGARTPEELETLLEDALLIRDHQALAGLFEAAAVLDAGAGLQARGGEQIALTAQTVWHADDAFVADPRHVLQTREIGLIVSEHCVNVARRDREGFWRYVVVFRFEPFERKP